MARWVRRAALAIVAATLVGCAGTDVALVTDDSRARGFRYYQASPYLLIHTDNRGGLTSRVVMLPDLNRLVSLRPYASFAAIGGVYEFKNGVLTTATSDADATLVPKAVLSALEKVVSLLADKQKGVPPPYLYKIVIEKGSVVLRGGPPLVDGKEIVVAVGAP